VPLGQDPVLHGLQQPGQPRHVQGLAEDPGSGDRGDAQGERDLVSGELPLRIARAVVGGDDRADLPAPRLVLQPAVAADLVELLARGRGEQHPVRRVQ